MESCEETSAGRQPMRGLRLMQWKAHGVPSRKAAPFTHRISAFLPRRRGPQALQPRPTARGQKALRSLGQSTATKSRQRFRGPRPSPSPPSPGTELKSTGALGLRRRGDLRRHTFSSDKERRIFTGESRRPVARTAAIQRGLESSGALAMEGAAPKRRAGILDDIGIGVGIPSF